MGLIQDIKEEALFDRASKEKVPFFQWFKWLETTINQEVLKFLFKSKAGKPESNGTKGDKKTLEKEKVKKELSNYLETQRRKSQLNPDLAS